MASETDKEYESYAHTLSSSSQYMIQYKYLIKFLRGERDEESEVHFPGHKVRRHPDIYSELSDLYVLDVFHGGMDGQSFRVSRQAPVDPDFHKALNREHQNQGTRLVMLKVTSLWSVNHLYLDAIGQRFQLNPLFFEEFISRFSFGLDTSRQPPMFLPSEKEFVLVVRTRMFHTVATLVKDASTRRLTVILLCFCFRPVPSGTTVGIQRVTSLEGFSASDLDEAAQNPCDFLYPFVKCTAQNTASDCSHFMAKLALGFKKEADDRFDLLTSIAWENRGIKIVLLSSLETLVRFLETHDPENSSKVRGLLPDLNKLVDYTREIESDCQRELQFLQSSEAIKETRRAIKQGEFVKRLTVVAFVFLPLSFSTSFFGMNVQQLGMDGVNISYFFLLASVTGLMAIFISVIIKPVEEVIERTKIQIVTEDTTYRYSDGPTARTAVWKIIRRFCRTEKLWHKQKLRLADENPWFRPHEIPTLPIIQRCWSYGRSKAVDIRRRVISRVVAGSFGITQSQHQSEYEGPNISDRLPEISQLPK